MAELTTIVSDLIKGKKTSEYLPQYIDGLKSLYSRMAYIRLALNYYTFSEMYYEMNKDLRKICEDETQSLQQLIQSVVIDKQNTDDTEDFIEKLRKSIIAKVETITGYADKLQIYEHILNRVEFKFNPCDYDTDYYKTSFENDIIGYVIGDRDNAAINMRLSMVMGELPMRMSKNKFFDVLNDSFSIYKGSEKQSVDDFAYRVRTAGTIYQTPEDKSFKKLSKTLNEFEMIDYEKINAEQFNLMRNKMDSVINVSSDYSDIFVSIMEIINDIYTIYLCENDADSKGLIDIIAYSHSVIEGMTEPDFYVAERFVQYEGLQEKIGLMISGPEAALSEITEINLRVIEQIGLLKDLKDLEKISLLQSGSAFVAFDIDLEKKEEADEGYIRSITESLNKEFAELFNNNSRIYNRAVMSAVVSNLPAYFNNIKEFEEYVHVALSQCNDEAEQKACMTLINMLITSE